jgi:hypothetical protein
MREKEIERRNLTVEMRDSNLERSGPNCVEKRP